MRERDILELMEEYKRLREFTVLPDWAEALMKENPDILRHEYGLLRAVMLNENSALPQKVKELIMLAIGVASNNQRVVDSHVKIAQKFGATKQEILEAIFLTLPIVGFQALQAMLRAIDIIKKE